MIRKCLHAFKRLADRQLSQLICASVDIECNTMTLGSDYGDWCFASDAINSESTIYSFGVGEDISFDLELSEKLHVTIHAFDPTPKSILWVRNQLLPANFVFHDYGLANFDGQVAFNAPENPRHVSHSILKIPSSGQIYVPVRTLETIMRSLGHHQIDVLKMDIEGSEYSVIDDLEKSNIRPRQVLVEFHHRFKSVGIHQTMRSIKQMKKLGYGVFFVSKTGEEVSFIFR